MTRHHRPTHRSTEPPRARRAPPVWLSLLMAAAVPAALYLLTHPLAAALLAGLVAGRLSGPLAVRRRVHAALSRLRRGASGPPLRLVAAVRSRD